MRSTSALVWLALLLVAASGVSMGATESPTVTVYSADYVQRQGGGGTCRWETKAYSTCSATCGGISTRQVYCSCTLSNGNVVTATYTNCDRDDLRSRPISLRSCSPECPVTTSPPDKITIVAQSTTAPQTLPVTVAPTTRSLFIAVSSQTTSPAKEAPTTEATTKSARSTTAASHPIWTWLVIAIAAVAVTVVV